MRTISIYVGVALLLGSACCNSGGGGGTGGNTGGTSGNSGGTSGGNGWNIITLDAADGGGSPLDDLEIAVGPSDVVGVGYLQDSLTQSTQGNELYDVRYVQVTPSSGAATQPQVIDQIQDLYGVTIAFQPSGSPAVGYLGGQPFGGNGAGASHYWYQSAAVVAFQSGSTWTKQVTDDGTSDPDGPTTMGTQTNVTSPYQATGPSVVGLYPALGFDSKGVAYDYFRDVFFGQSEGGNSDYNATRIIGEVGGPTTWTMEWAFLGNTWQLNGGGTPVGGLGGHLHLVMANDQPALVTDEFGQNAGAEYGGQNVDFMMRLGPNNWSVPVRVFNADDTQTGPALAYDPTYGYAAVVYDEGSSRNQLLFSSSKDGTTWSAPDDVFAGSGGWYPSVAIDPTRGAPAIADFFCSTQSGIGNLQSCPASQRAIEVRTLQGVAWGQPETVDPAGGYQPKLAFLSTGKMVIAYRQLDAKGKVGPLVLAVQQ